MYTNMYTLPYDYINLICFNPLSSSVVFIHGYVRLLYLVYLTYLALYGDAIEGEDIFNKSWNTKEASTLDDHVKLSNGSVNGDVLNIHDDAILHAHVLNTHGDVVKLHHHYKVNDLLVNGYDYILNSYI